MNEVFCTICGRKTEDAIPVRGKLVCSSCSGEVVKLFQMSMAVDHRCNHVPDLVTQGSSFRDAYTPRRIKEELDRYVVGQEQAKKILSVAAHNHYIRIRQSKDDSVIIEKSNVLLLGPTGCGKTHLLKTLSKVLGVPFAIVSATSFTETGYVGDDVDSCIKLLYEAAGQNVELAEKGIIFIDEIDKLVSSDGAKRDVGGKGVQQALLTLLEGTKVNVRKGAGAMSQQTFGAGQDIFIDTKNILFVCGGAFSGLEEIIARRLNCATRPIGFLTNSEQETDPAEVKKNILLKARKEDLNTFGFIPEFLGRLPIVACLEEMTTAMMKRILTEPKNSIVSQYVRIFEEYNIELVFEDDALEKIADLALEKGTGARGLRDVIESVLLDVMYGLPYNDVIKIIITKEFLCGKSELKVIYNLFRSAYETTQGQIY